MSALVPFPIAPPPGVVKTESNRVAEGRWIVAEKILFVKRLPQKMGGNVRVTQSAMSGTPRATHCWRDFSQNQYVACGTYRKLYAMDSSYVPTDITPLSSSGTFANNPYTTVSGSTSVTVHHVAHGRNVGDTIITAGASAFNNVTMNGTFIVITITGADDYTITAVTTANASSAGGGAACTYDYEIGVGTELGAYGQGWGVGPWGLGTWGTARGSSAIFYEPRIWSLDHFGKVLLGAYNGGSLWSFDPTQSTPWARAVSTFGGVAMNAPTDFRAMFITPERFVFGLCDSMVVKACSQGDPTIWTPASSNTAFQRTLQEGTKLIGGRVLAPYISLVWTDAALYLFQYTGSQFVYNSSLAGKNCGLISPNAAVTVSGIAYWMGTDNFYTYNGSVVPMNNVEDIRKYVFDAVPSNLMFQCNVKYVAKYNQLWWSYPTTGDTNPTKYVIYDIAEGVWVPGTEDFYSSAGVTAGRASGSHFTQGDTSPIMAGTDSFLYNHDPVGDSHNDNGNALTWTLTMAPIAQSEGLSTMKVENVLWDFKDQAGSISATLNGYDRLTDSAVMDTQTQTVPATNAGLTDYDVIGRYIGLTLTSSALGNYMRLGKSAAFIKPIGRRS